MVDLTLNYKFTLPQYNQPGWDTQMNTNLTMIDTLLGQFNTGINLKGAWVVNTLYPSGVSVIDTVTGKIYTAGVTNTSGNISFAFDRAANPTWWTDITNPAISAQQSAIAAAASAASVNTTLSSFRNRLHNGAFLVNQRGVGPISCPANTLTYTSDRWAVLGTGFIVSTSMSTGTSFGGTGNSIGMSGTIPQSGALTLLQRIEALNSIELYQKQITVQFWINYTISAGTTTFAATLSTPTAADNYASKNTIQTIAFSPPNNTAAQLITLTFNAMPASVANGLELSIVAVQGAAFGGAITMVLGTITLEPGIVANPFDKRPYSVELALCQRYYERYTINSGLSTTVSGVTWSHPVSFKVTKRAIPAINIVTTGTNASVSGLTNVTSTDINVANITGSAATYCSLTGYTYEAVCEL